MSVERMSDYDLLEYIKHKSCRCCDCAELKRRILERGLEEIDKWDGMICGGIEDIFIKRGRW